MYHTAGKKLVRQAMSAPYLTREEEHDLALRWQEKGDNAALQKIVIAHMRLVIAMALKFRRFGLSLSDLVQEGHVGLMEAAARFDAERQIRFSTYATWWVRAAMQDYVLRNWSIVRGGTSSGQKALFFNLRRLRAKLALETGTASGASFREQIAERLGVREEDVAMMDARLAGADTSLNVAVGGEEREGTERMALLVCDRPLPDEAASASIDTERRVEWLDKALTALDARELSIIRERRLRDESATLEALGQKMGISKERVRQIEGRALRKLRAALVSANPEMAAGAA